MSQTWTIARRELMALFCSPIAYAALAIFAVLTSWWFVNGVAPGGLATMREEFSLLVYLLAFIAPAISMRMLSEEYQSGTIELLATSPISDTQVVIGKWLGSLVFFAVLLSPILVHVLVLEWYADPDLGPIFTGIVGLMLVGGLYLAIGVMVSAASGNLVVSYLVTMVLTGILSIVMYWLSVDEGVWSWLQTASGYINVNVQYQDFAKGLIDIRNLVYFFSGIALFLFIAVKLLESRRWR